MTVSKRGCVIGVVRLVFMFILTIHTGAFAQTSDGVISGLVRDTSGAVVPGATVKITNVETGISRTAMTDAAGRYRVPGLIPDHYQVETSMEGFQTEVRQGIELTVGRESVINVDLKIGQITEKAVVTANAPLVETTSSTLSSLVGQEAISELPLNGRSFDQLISLQASMPVNYSHGTSKNAGSAAAFSVNGARTQANLFMIDGTEMVGGGQSTTLPGGVLGKMMGVDAVQEFSVLSSNYSAAYGKRSGGIINIATRSGTNALHGSVFEFLRNSALDARNFFDVAQAPQPTPVPPFRRNQFGGSVGGPIQRDRTFFFGNYEALRETLGMSSIAFVPDNASRALAIPAVQPYMVLFGPPNGRLLPGGLAESISSPSQPSKQDFFLIRVDHKISDRDSVFARYYFSDAHVNTPEANPFFSGKDDTRDQILTLEEKRVYPTMLNTFRFGFTRGHLFGTGVPAVELDPNLRFLPGAPSVGQINFSTQTSGNSITRAGIGSSVNRGMTVNQFDTGDQVFLYRGAHSLQFGGNVQKIQHNDADTSDNYGNFTFPDLDRFLQGRPSRFSAPSPLGGDLHKAWRLTYFGVFLQDDYKIRPNLTLNLGIRYEALTPPTEGSGNRLSNYHTHLENGLRVVDNLPTVGSPFFKSNHDLFAPRAGFAWDVFNDGKMALRGGFGIFYDPIESEPRTFSTTNPPFFSTLQIDNPPPPFPLGFSGGGGSTPRIRPLGIDFDLDTPTRVQYNFSIQRQITTNTMVNIGYVGSHSYHLTRLTDFNYAIYQIQPDGSKFYAANAPRRNPIFSSSRFIVADVSSSYNSLQLDFTQRMSHGMRYKVSYSFAKNIDETSSTTASHGTGSVPQSQDPENRRADRGPSVYNVPHNAVMNLTYDLPWNNFSGFPGKILGGWQLGTIVTLSAGQAFTAATGFSRSRDQQDRVADRPNLKPGADNNHTSGTTAGCGVDPRDRNQIVPSGQKLGTPERYFDPCVFELPEAGTYGNLGRNTVVGPGIATVDFSLTKLTQLGERLKMDFRAEFFNLLNRANFGLPNAQVFSTNLEPSGTAGRITSTTTTSRQIQFALKLLF